MSAYLPTTPFPFRRFRSVKRQCRCKYLLSYEGISGNLSLLNFPRLTLLHLSLSFTLSPPPTSLHFFLSLNFESLTLFLFLLVFSSSGFVLKPPRNLYLYLFFVLPILSIGSDKAERILPGRVYFLRSGLLINICSNLVFFLLNDSVLFL